MYSWELSCEVHNMRQGEQQRCLWHPAPWQLLWMHIGEMHHMQAEALSECLRVGVGAERWPKPCLLPASALLCWQVGKLQGTDVVCLLEPFR